MVVMIVKVLKEPDGTVNYFPESSANEEILDQYRNDRLTYFAILEAMLGKQPGLQNPGKFMDDPMNDIDLVYEMEFDRLEK